MPAVATKETFERLRERAPPLTGARTDYDSLLETIGNAKYVLLGEATHGTHEFYKARAQITKRLIQEKGFTVLAWEADAGIHFDETRAVEPLERASEWEKGELPETYPSAYEQTTRNP